MDFDRYSYSVHVWPRGSLFGNATGVILINTRVIPDRVSQGKIRKVGEYVVRSQCDAQGWVNKC